jgi:diadenosine tetraphosphate (Ap4A) HIT family hydrolase
MAFHLHTQLDRDCIFVGCFTLCRLLLMNDKQFPWFILVPEVENVTEIYQLNKIQQSLLIEESSYLSEHIAKMFKADKINVAAIGNLVPQLHVHHIVRYRNDPAWPSPIWGKFSAIPYSEPEKEALVKLMVSELDFVSKTENSA